MYLPLYTESSVLFSVSSHADQGFVDNAKKTLYWLPFSSCSFQELLFYSGSERVLRSCLSRDTLLAANSHSAGPSSQVSKLESLPEPSQLKDDVKVWSTGACMSTPMMRPNERRKKSRTRPKTAPECVIRSAHDDMGWQKDTSYANKKVAKLSDAWRNMADVSENVTTGASTCLKVCTSYIVERHHVHHV